MQYTKYQTIVNTLLANLQQQPDDDNREFILAVLMWIKDMIVNVHEGNQLVAMVATKNVKYVIQVANTQFPNNTIDIDALLLTH